MSVEVLSGHVDGLGDANQFNLLMNMIGKSQIAAAAVAASPMDASQRRPQQRMRFAAGNFPKEYDLSQPSKSWWRYFEKQTDTNTAVCYTCGAIFNRGPKQSTTSLSHHLKMYHREQFIFIQQAKDDDLKVTGKGGKKASKSSVVKRVKTEEITQHLSDAQEVSFSKKTPFNMALIKVVKEKPEIYDSKARGSLSDDDMNVLWDTVTAEISENLPSEAVDDKGQPLNSDTVRKRWLQIRDRYRKELKFAIRDNFAYKPKWPYFWDLGFLDEHLKDSSDRAHERTTPEKRRVPEFSSNNNDLRTLIEDSNMATNLLSNIFSACANASSDSNDHEAETARSTDSAIASTSEHDSDLNDFDTKQNSALLTFQQLFHEQGHNDSTVSAFLTVPECEPPAKRPRPPRKSTPLRSKPLAQESKTSSEAPYVSPKDNFEWLEDEDMLFGKIVALRLRALPVTSKKQMKIAIERLFEHHERGLPLPEIN